MKRTSVPPPSEKEVLSYTNVPVEIAAPFIGWSVPTLYLAMQQNVVPFGFSVKTGERSWAYNISPGGLVKYKHEGCPVIRLKEIQMMVADSAKEVIDAKMQGLAKVLDTVLIS